MTLKSYLHLPQPEEGAGEGWEDGGYNSGRGWRWMKKERRFSGWNRKQWKWLKGCREEGWRRNVLRRLGEGWGTRRTQEGKSKEWQEQTSVLFSFFFDMNLWKESKFLCRRICFLRLTLSTLMNTWWYWYSDCTIFRCMYASRARYSQS